MNASERLDALMWLSICFAAVWVALTALQRWGRAALAFLAVASGLAWLAVLLATRGAAGVEIPNPIEVAP